MNVFHVWINQPSFYLENDWNETKLLYEQLSVNIKNKNWKKFIIQNPRSKTENENLLNENMCMIHVMRKYYPKFQD